MKESSSQFCEFGGNVRKKNKKIFVMHTTMLADKTLSEYIRYTSIVKEKDVMCYYTIQDFFSFTQQN